MGTETETTPKSLVHMCAREEWEAARAVGEYRAPSLAEVGFIHLSAPYQAHLPANRIFAGRTDLVLLWLDPGRLGAPVKWEPGVPTDPESMTFPHLYGPLPVAAVVEVTAYLPGSDGIFAPLTAN
ncbi:MAG: Glutathione transferase [Glaciihabitans sp.]|nr:Glutathione transferase [Glaciihabitans sp.]